VLHECLLAFEKLAVGLTIEIKKERTHLLGRKLRLKLLEHGRFAHLTRADYERDFFFVEMSPHVLVERPFYHFFLHTFISFRRHLG
jgi:hypothetical protein